MQDIQERYQTNYPLQALNLLLQEDCLSARYYPLIPYKDILMEGFQKAGCDTRDAALELMNQDYCCLGLPSMDMASLLRRFFLMYEPKPAKFREIEKLTHDPEERAAFRELYALPGVKRIRAQLYYRAGYKSLREIAAAVPDEIMRKTADVIAAQQLNCIVPLPKEVRTHIAVARAFTWRDTFGA